MNKGGNYTGSNPVLTTNRLNVMQEWIEKYFSESWEDIQTDIDFSKYESVKTSNSLHVHEVRYDIDGEKYRLLYAIGHEEPLVQILKK